MQERTYLKIPELGELLAAVVKPTEVGFGLVVHDLVCSYVAALCKPLSAYIALIWAFTGVSAFVGLVFYCQR